MKPSNGASKKGTASIAEAQAALFSQGSSYVRPPCFCCAAPALKWTQYGPSCPICYDEIQRAITALAYPAGISGNSIFAPALAECLKTTNPAAITIIAAYFEAAILPIISPDSPRAILGLRPLK